MEENSLGTERAQRFHDLRTIEVVIVEAATHTVMLAIQRRRARGTEEDRWHLVALVAANEVMERCPPS